MNVNQIIEAATTTVTTTDSGVERRPMEWKLEGVFPFTFNGREVQIRVSRKGGVFSLGVCSPEGQPFRLVGRPEEMAAGKAAFLNAVETAFENMAKQEAEHQFRQAAKAAAQENAFLYVGRSCPAPMRAGKTERDRAKKRHG